MQRKQMNADLTSFASLLGDSFSSKVDMLTQILQNSHYPSLGRYKEKLLANVISEYLPKKYEVGTGFVLFVHDASEERQAIPGFDRLNMGSHTASKQCDIIVYDASSVPLIFKDDDFVIVRPESVKAIIEVKGSANKKEIDKTLDSFLDFGQKWVECQRFYKKHHQPLVKRPSMYAMCWDVSRSKTGRELTDGTKIRKQIATYYSENLDEKDLMGFPLLEKLFIYNECEVTYSGWFEKGNDGGMGWSTDSGQFIRFNEKKSPFRSGDSTIASLLAGLHYSLGEEFNRFYSYVSETKEYMAVPYKHHGFSCWLSEIKLQKAANTDYIIDKKDKLTP